MEYLALLAPVLALAGLPLIERLERWAISPTSMTPLVPPDGRPAPAGPGDARPGPVPPSRGGHPADPGPPRAAPHRRRTVPARPSSSPSV